MQPGLKLFGKKIVNIGSLVHKGSNKKNWYSFRNIPKPMDLPLPRTFRHKNVIIGQKSWVIQGQNQWLPKFHIKFRNTGPSPSFSKYS